MWNSCEKPPEQVRDKLYSKRRIIFIILNTIGQNCQHPQSPNKKVGTYLLFGHVTLQVFQVK